MIGCFYHLNLVFYKFWGIWIYIILWYLLVNVILKFDFLYLIGLIGSKDEITYRAVMIIIPFPNTETYSHMNLNLFEWGDNVQFRMGCFFRRVNCTPDRWYLFKDTVCCCYYLIDEETKTCLLWNPFILLLLGTIIIFYVQITKRPISLKNIIFFKGLTKIVWYPKKIEI